MNLFAIEIEKVSKPSAPASRWRTASAKSTMNNPAIDDRSSPRFRRRPVKNYLARRINKHTSARTHLVRPAAAHHQDHRATSETARARVGRVCVRVPPVQCQFPSFGQSAPRSPATDQGRRTARRCYRPPIHRTTPAASNEPASLVANHPSSVSMSRPMYSPDTCSPRTTISQRSSVPNGIPSAPRMQLQHSEATDPPTVMTKPQ